MSGDSPLRLVIFDVDGTLVDSQADIVAAMGMACASANVPEPSREAVLGTVGLSLDVMMQQLAPGHDHATHLAMVRGYKDAYMTLRAQAGAAQSSPLYPGVIEMLDALRSEPGVLLGVATGKSRRGLDKLIEGHGLEGYFVTQQVADHHPSKPHPSMILTALSETGVEAENAVMLGDTSFDMEMAASAGIDGVAVGWGYHPRARLGAARHHIDHFRELPGLLEQIWGNEQ